MTDTRRFSKTVGDDVNNVGRISPSFQFDV